MLDPQAAAADYCRRARRIRASFDRNPQLRQHALGQLALQRDQELQSSRVSRSISTAQAEAAPLTERRFADQVGRRLQPFGFSYSDRLDLLNVAERIGISRFRANMILALHEHRVRTTVVVSPVQPVPASPSFLLVLAVEVCVVGFLAWVCM